MTRHPRVVAIVEARMTSTRLPGKVLMAPKVGKPMLELLIERLRLVERLDAVCIATTTNDADAPIAALAERLGIGCWRGSETDVMGRVAEAARFAEAEVIVEVTGDCPLMDPGVLGEAIADFLGGNALLVTNAIPRSYPLGMDTFIFARSTLEDAAARTDDPIAREHVAYFLRTHPELYPQRVVTAPPDLTAPNLHLTLDYREDFDLIAAIFDALYPVAPAFSLADILALLRRQPELGKINAHLRPQT